MQVKLDSHTKENQRSESPEKWLLEEEYLAINPFPNDKFYSYKLKGLADENFKFDENGRKFSKQVENTVGKGEIAR